MNREMVSAAVRNGLSHYSDLDPNEQTPAQLVSDITHCVLAALSPSPQGVTEEQVEAEYQIGDSVEKYAGEARYAGRVVSVYQTTKGGTRYVVEVEPQGFQMICTAGMLRRVLEQFAATPAPAQGEYVLVPRVLTDEIRFATWFAQYKHGGGTDEEATALATEKVRDQVQKAQDTAAYAATLAAASAPNAPDPVGEAVKAEREACAKIAEEYTPHGDATGEGIAAAIRARKP